jgi:hypothetical protein
MRPVWLEVYDGDCRTRGVATARTDQDSDKDHCGLRVLQITDEGYTPDDIARRAQTIHDKTSDCSTDCSTDYSFRFTFMTI